MYAFYKDGAVRGNDKKEMWMFIKRKTRIISLTLGVVLSAFCLASFLCIEFFNLNVSAETFESAQGISFTFNPTVKITITGGTGATSSGLTIDNLTPGDYKDSNIITVTAGSNSPLGYTLSSTVGSSTYNFTELRRNGTETANKFTNLSSNKASLSAFDPGYWGYSYSTNSGSTWISGDIVSGTSAGYNGLPIYTTASPIKLVNSSTASESSVQFKIGARATSSQLAGTYSNVVNFIGVAKVVTTTYTINYNANAGSDTVTNMPTPNPLQDTDTTGNAAIQISSNVPVRTGYMFKGWCTSQTSDDTCSSDVVQPGGYVALNPGTSSPTATVTKNLYAMWSDNTLYLQNATMADCGKTMYDIRDGASYTTATIANTCWMTQNLRFQGTDLKVGESDVTSDITMTYGQLTSGSSYTEPRIASGSTTDYGTYYNFCAASAGEACNDTTKQDATRSVCPAGWKLPTQTQFDAIPILDSNFTASAGLAGFYNNGSLSYAGSRGFWWASTASSTLDQYFLRYYSDGGNWVVDIRRKYIGDSVRCVLNS